MEERFGSCFDKTPFFSVALRLCVIHKMDLAENALDFLHAPLDILQHVVVARMR